MSLSNTRHDGYPCAVAKPRYIDDAGSCRVMEFTGQERYDHYRYRHFVL